MDLRIAKERARIREVGAMSKAHGWAKYDKEYRQRLQQELLMEEVNEEHK